MKKKKKEKKNLEFWGEEAKKRIPENRLKIMDELVLFSKEICFDILRSHKIKIITDKNSYHFNNDYEFEYGDIDTVKTNSENWIEREKDRGISVGVTFRKKFEYKPEFENMYSIHFSIESGINGALDYSIWILEYLYRNNKELFEELFSGKEEKVYKQSRGTKVEHYCDIFFTEQEVDYIKEVSKKILSWTLNRKEIIEVLQSERWIEGYVPPTPL